MFVLSEKLGECHHFVNRYDPFVTSGQWKQLTKLGKCRFNATFGVALAGDDDRC